MAVVMRMAFSSLPGMLGSVGKNSFAMIGVMNANTRKSYHSRALPMTAATMLRVGTALCCTVSPWGYF
ncbi:hypothetical protein D3C78_1599080 [compost metagenome]